MVLIPSFGSTRFQSQRLPRAQFRKPGVLHELVHVLQGEDLATGGEKQLLHVFAADAESASCDRGAHLELGLIRRLAIHAERSQMLDTGHLVSRRAVVLRRLRFNDHLGIELVGGHEVRRLVETGQTFGTFGLAIADACA